MNELPPCVLPRRRFVRRFLAVCLVLQVVGLCVGCARFDKFNSDWVVAAVSVAELSLMSLPYLLLTLVVVEWWWPSPEILSPLEFAAIPFALVSVAGLFFYPLGFWLVCRWRRAENRSKIQK